MSRGKPNADPTWMAECNPMHLFLFLVFSHATSFREQIRCTLSSKPPLDPMSIRNDSPSKHLDVGVIEEGTETDAPIEPSVPVLHSDEVPRFTKQEKWFIVIFTAFIGFFRWVNIFATLVGKDLIHFVTQSTHSQYLFPCYTCTRSGI